MNKENLIATQACLSPDMVDDFVQKEYMCHAYMISNETAGYSEFTQLLRDHGVSIGGTLSYMKAGETTFSDLGYARSTNAKERQEWRFDFLSILIESGVEE